MDLNQVTFPVTDIARSVAFYERLGFNQIVEAPHYARFECRTGGPSFSVHLVETVGQCSIVVYFECEDVDAMVEELKGREGALRRLQTRHVQPARWACVT